MIHLVLVLAKSFPVELGDVATFRQILAKNPDPVFVRAPLPRGVSGAEENLNPELFPKAFVIRKLMASVIGDGAKWQIAEHGDGAGGDLHCDLLLNLGEKVVARFPIHHGDHGVLTILAYHAVSLPVAALLSFLCAVASFVDGGSIFDLPSPILRGETSFPAPPGAA